MTDILTEEFRNLCVQNFVEVSVSPLSNPGNPYKARKILEFKNFNDVTVRVTRIDTTVQDIPARGTIQIMLEDNEPLPYIEKVG